MTISAVKLALARARIDDSLNKVLVLVANDAPLIDSEEVERMAGEMVTTHLRIASQALKDFEDAARGK